jgi:hypothetical protein
MLTALGHIPDTQSKCFVTEPVMMMQWEQPVPMMAEDVQVEEVPVQPLFLALKDAEAQRAPILFAGRLVEGQRELAQMAAILLDGKLVEAQRD